MISRTRLVSPGAEEPHDDAAGIGVNCNGSRVTGTVIMES